MRKEKITQAIIYQERSSNGLDESVKIEIDNLEVNKSQNQVLADVTYHGKTHKVDYPLEAMKHTYRRYN